MGIITTQDIEKIVKEFGESVYDDDWYLIINKEFVDGISKNFIDKPM